MIQIAKKEALFSILENEPGLENWFKKHSIPFLLFDGKKKIRVEANNATQMFTIGWIFGLFQAQKK